MHAISNRHTDSVQLTPSIIAHLFGSSLTAKEAFLEAGGCLLKLIQAVLLAFHKAMCLLSFAHRAQPLPLRHLLQGRGQAEQVTAPVTAVTQNNLLLMMAALTQLAIQGDCDLAQSLSPAYSSKISFWLLSVCVKREHSFASISRETDSRKSVAA